MTGRAPQTELRFRLVKNSAPDPVSVRGHAAPSWLTFDSLTWERESSEGTHRVTLTRDRRTKPTGLGTYRARLEREGRRPQEFTGSCWQTLVRDVKEESRRLA